MHTTKFYHKLFVLLMLSFIITGCVESTQKNESPTGASQSHTHGDGEGEHTHQDEETPIAEDQSPSATSEQEETYEEETYEETIEMDVEPIYKIGDIYKATPAKNSSGEATIFPSEAPQEKLLALIGLDDEAENLIADDIYVFLKSLDSFARRQNKVNVTVINYLLSPEECRSYLKKINLDHLDVVHVDFNIQEQLDVNMGPMYFRLDKDNRIKSILAGQHYSAEFD